MSGTVHQSFTADLNSQPYDSSLKRMESNTRSSTARMEKEFGKMDVAVSKQSRGMGRSAFGSRAGQVALQAQDIGIQMQQGAKWSTIIAQQGSQILSVFGPYGALLGGLTAAGAMFWEVVRGAKALNKEAAETRRNKAIEENSKATSKGAEQIRADQEATQRAKLRAAFGKEGADQAERELAFREKIAEIDRSMMNEHGKAAAKEAAADRFNAENKLQERAKQRDIREGIVGKAGQGILDRAAQIRGMAPSKSEQRREDRAQARAERRAINEENDRRDRARRNESPSKRSEIDKRTKGLSKKEREEFAQDALDAAKAAKNDKVMANFNDDQIMKIVNSIQGLFGK